MLVSVGVGVKKMVSAVFFFFPVSHGLGVKPGSPSRCFNNAKQDRCGKTSWFFFYAKLKQKANCRPERAMNPVSG